MRDLGFLDGLANESKRDSNVAAGDRDSRPVRLPWRGYLACAVILSGRERVVKTRGMNESNRHKHSCHNGGRACVDCGDNVLGVERSG